jgi:protoporphyrinogen/coproporphyrinogen III oxidase
VADRAIGGIYAANDWVDRADNGGLLLVTAAHAAHAENLDDDTLLARLEADVEKLHPEVVGQITERVVVRHPHYTPTMGPGSIRRMVAARAELPHQRVDLAGDHMTAPWMEGAIRSGEMAADRLASRE